jgi:hypothetical protein
LETSSDVAVVNTELSSDVDLSRLAPASAIAPDNLTNAAITETVRETVLHAAARAHRRSTLGLDDTWIAAAREAFLIVKERMRDKIQGTSCYVQTEIVMDQLLSELADGNQVGTEQGPVSPSASAAPSTTHTLGETPSITTAKEKIQLLRRAIQYAYTGSAEHGSFLRGGGGEWTPSVFMTLDELESLLAAVVAQLGGVTCQYCDHLIQPRDPYHVHGHNECLCGVTPKHNDYLHEGSPQWQPIATAPKDGGNVMLWCVDLVGGNPRVATGSWHDTYGGSWWDYHMEYTLNPTHWQPLPPPPTGIADQSQEKT